jgi:Protein of unknown function (DUF2809)
MKFRFSYFIVFVILLIIEICIAKYVHDTIVRPYVGDFLVVILIYCFVQSFFNTGVFKTAVATLFFAYAVEVAQYFKIVNILNLQNHKLASIIIGTSFEWIDILMYTLGIAMILFVEKILLKKIS